MHAILEREFLSLFRTWRPLAIQLAVSLGCLLLVALRWPDSGQVDLTGERAREVFRLFSYGLLSALVLLVPSFPAASIVRERQKRTLVLLLHAPITATGIYFGKLIANVGFVLILVTLSLPAAAACHAMGGISLWRQLIPLYVVLLLLTGQMGAVGLWVSSQSGTPDAAMRKTYGCVLGLVVLSLVPHYFLQGNGGMLAGAARQLRLLSPVPAIMQLTGQGQLGQRALLDSGENPSAAFAVLALLTTAILAVLTIRRLSHRMFDRARAAGTVTEKLSTSRQWFRRLAFLVDPQRRKSEIGPWTNPILVKEFRTRQFGRLHWLMRLAAGCAVVSLGLTWVTTLGAADWGVETIGGIIVILQTALLMLLTPGLAAGLFSSELESGGWRLLRVTPLTAGIILRGKLLSAGWTMLLLLCATLPGYVVMIWISPLIRDQVRQIVITLALTACFAVVLSATVSSFVRRSAVAVAVSYLLLLTLCAGPMLVWLGRDAPFGHTLVEQVLSLNPLATALSIIRLPGFASYRLVPANWYLLTAASLSLIIVLIARIRWLLKPD